MKSKMTPKYVPEINQLAENHAEAILALCSDVFHDGMKVGLRNGIIGALLGAMLGSVCLHVAEMSYKEHGEQS